MSPSDSAARVLRHPQIMIAPHFEQRRDKILAQLETIAFQQGSHPEVEDAVRAL